LRESLYWFELPCFSWSLFIQFLIAFLATPEILDAGCGHILAYFWVE
jgi:hypothetical protein